MSFWKKSKTGKKSVDSKSRKQSIPDRFPWWGRMKIAKQRPTLVIDKDKVRNKKNGKVVDAYVHREVTHSFKKQYEKVDPNPDRTDPRPMYLKNPRKVPMGMIRPDNKNWEILRNLRERYAKNNKKGEK